MFSSCLVACLVLTSSGAEQGSFVREAVVAADGSISLGERAATDLAGVVAADGAFSLSDQAATDLARPKANGRIGKNKDAAPAAAPAPSRPGTTGRRAGGRRAGGRPQVPSTHGTQGRGPEGRGRHPPSSPAPTPSRKSRGNQGRIGRQGRKSRRKLAELRRGAAKKKAAQKAAKKAAKKAKKAAERARTTTSPVFKRAATPATGECAEPHDFVVGIDASKSIGKDNWPVEVSFANSVIAELLGMGAGHRVATYYFAGVATKVSDFSDNATKLQSELSDLEYADVQYGATNHPAGFMFAEQLFGSSPLADSKKLHLLITDGAPWKSCEHLTDEAVRALPCTPACQNTTGSCDYMNKKNKGTKPVGAYCKCAMHTADAFNSKYVTYTVGVLKKKNRNPNREKKLKGLATAPEFYMPASFEDLPSVLRNVTFGVCQDPATTTTTTTTTTEASACDAMGPDLHLRLDRATVIQNNLGDHGPDAGVAHIRYKNVATLADGTVVDLIVSAQGDYKPFKGQPSANGISGSFGIIGLEASTAGNSVDLDFSFVSSSSGLPIELEEIDFSILDEDKGLTSAQESVTASGFDRFYLSNATEVQVSAAPDGRTTFTATVPGHHFDNPTTPLHLTEEQSKRCINFVFTTVSKFSMTFAVSDSAWEYGRDFLFSGMSAVKDCGHAGVLGRKVAQ